MPNFDFGSAHKYNMYGQLLDEPSWVNQPQAPSVPQLPSYPTASQANATNLAYVQNAIASDPSYSAAQSFLDPNNALANWDVARHGAEHAAGIGMAGSGIAGQYTANLRQRDIERRAALGSQLLSGAYGRTPAPVDPYAQAHGEFQNAQLLAGILNRYGSNRGGYGGGQAPTVMGGGGKSAPTIIGGGGMGSQAGYGTTGGLGPLRGGGMPLGGDQIAYGYGGPGFNAVNQQSEFYPGEYTSGTMFSGDPNAPQTIDDVYGSLGL